MIREAKCLALALGIGALLSSCQTAKPVPAALGVTTPASQAPAPSKRPTVPAAPNTIIRPDRAIKTVTYPNGKTEQVSGWNLTTNRKTPWFLDIHNDNVLYPIQVMRTETASDGTVRVVEQWQVGTTGKGGRLPYLDRHEVLGPLAGTGEFFFVRYNDDEGNWRPLDSSNRVSFTGDNSNSCIIHWILKTVKVRAYVLLRPAPREFFKAKQRVEQQMRPADARSQLTTKPRPGH
jgi:hypothetical protein